MAISILVSFVVGSVPLVNASMVQREVTRRVPAR